jgi:hypothetical protein
MGGAAARLSTLSYRDMRAKESRMTNIDECVPGRRARVLQTGVARVVGKIGTIVEVSRVRRPPDGPLRERVTVDVPGHGEIGLSPGDIEVLPEEGRSA